MARIIEDWISLLSYIYLFKSKFTLTSSTYLLLFSSWFQKTYSSTMHWDFSVNVLTPKYDWIQPCGWSSEPHRLYKEKQPTLNNTTRKKISKSYFVPPVSSKTFVVEIYNQHVNGVEFIPIYLNRMACVYIEMYFEFM